MPAGRPSDYSDEILEKAEAYLETHDGRVVPSVAGLASAIGVARSTVYDWAGQEEKAEFSDIVERILEKQEILLIDNGLTGDFNPTIAKLLLSKHGYADKSQVDANVVTESQEDWVKRMAGEQSS